MKDRSDIKIGEINFHLCIEKQICPFLKKSLVLVVILLLFFPKTRYNLDEHKTQ